MADKAKWRIRPYLIAAAIPVVGLIGFIALIALVAILVAIASTFSGDDDSLLILADPLIALILGCIAGIFWLPACRLLRGSKHETLLHFMMAGAVAGWFFGFLVDGPIACTWASIGASLEALFASVQYNREVEAETVEACTRDFPLVSRMTVRGALGAGFWILFYWKFFIRPGQVRRDTAQNKAESHEPESI